jgi:drug/metabolite transporter (DMT)-like permease
MKTHDCEIGSTALLDPPVETAPVKPVAKNVFRAVIGRWWVAFSASSLFVVSGHLLIKAGLNAAAATTSQSAGFTRILHSVFQVEVIAGLLIYFLGSVCWMIAVAQREISFLYPLSSINYVLVVIVSYLLFSEAISWQRAFGVTLIVLGMVLMNRRAGSALA